MVTFNLFTREQLSEYDIILAVDKSGSMSGAPSPARASSFKNRWHEAQELCIGFAHFADEVDDDGLTLITFGNTLDVFDGVKADAVEAVFKNNTPYGGTPLTEALQAAVKKKWESSKKAIVVIFTDGVPNNTESAMAVIMNAANSIKVKEDITFLFIQVGNDPSATSYLRTLDDDLTRRGARFDIVDAITVEEAERMTPEQMLSKALQD